MKEHVRTAALTGIDGLVVRVEVDVSRGLPGVHLVGLPNAEVRESRSRVVAALRNSGCRLPASKFVINLAPAGIRKEGASFDLAIALALLKAVSPGARNEGPVGRSKALFLGELSLFGELRPVLGLMSMVDAASRRGMRTAVVPAEQAWEARLISGMQVIGVRTLREAVSWWMQGEVPTPPPGIPRHEGLAEKADLTRASGEWTSFLRSLAGMPLLRRAFLLAQAGGHPLFMSGPPGTGKTRLAHWLGRLQPPLTEDEAREVTRIQSALGGLEKPGLVTRRPFRAPHHSVSRTGLVGGGHQLHPGEATRAHHGVLFLDELTEFQPGVLDALREPMAEGQVRLVRGAGQRCFPSCFQLVAAANPCRCGLSGKGQGLCRCTPGELRRYRSRLSGPLLDRFDLFVEVDRWQGRFLGKNGLSAEKDSQDSTATMPSLKEVWSVRKTLTACRGQVPRLTEEAAVFLDEVRLRLGLSLRATERCARVARTLAALDGRQLITGDDLTQSLEFRRPLFSREVEAG